MKTKQEIIDRLNGNIKDIRALIKNINAWDIYNDENWENLINSMKDARDFIKGDKKNGKK